MMPTNDSTTQFSTRSELPARHGKWSDGSCARRLTLVGAMLLCVSANALVIFPNASEWSAWPDYCKARTISLNHAQPYQKRTMTAAEVERWEDVIGPKVFVHLHHGCRGILHLMRAERMVGLSEQQYRAQLNAAADEAKYLRDRTPGDHPLHFKMRSVLAQVEYRRGRREKAIAELYKLVEAAPAMAEMYATLAVYLFREKEYSKARSVLETGLENVPEPTAEMHYFLGLVLVKQKAWEEARTHAEKAYEMGYPLPGLRRKLQAAGHWQP